MPGYDTVVAIYVYKAQPGESVQEVMRVNLRMVQMPPIRMENPIGEESWLFGETGLLFRQSGNVIFIGAAPAIPKTKVRSIAAHIARRLQPR